MHVQHITVFPNVQWACESVLRIVQVWLSRCVFRPAMPRAESRRSGLLLSECFPTDYFSNLEAFLTCRISASTGKLFTVTGWSRRERLTQNIPIKLATDYENSTTWCLLKATSRQYSGSSSYQRWWRCNDSTNHLVHGQNWRTLLQDGDFRSSNLSWSIIHWPESALQSVQIRCNWRLCEGWRGMLHYSTLCAQISSVQ